MSFQTFIKPVQTVTICPSCQQYQGCEHLLQEISLPNAEAKGNPWTAEELEFLLDTADESLVEVAAVLNRTYYATSRARSLAKRGILKT